MMPKRPSKIGQVTREYHARVSWCADDVRTLRPDWDDERCNEFLMDNEDYILCAIIEGGWDAIRDLIRWEESK
jgi:hypothetical protein